MQLEKIVALATVLGERLTFVGVMDRDSGIDVNYRESGCCSDIKDALASARQYVHEANRTGLSYGVKACIGSDIEVRPIDGFEFST